MKIKTNTIKINLSSFYVAATVCIQGLKSGEIGGSYIVFNVYANRQLLGKQFHFCDPDTAKPPRTTRSFTFSSFEKIFCFPTFFENLPLFMDLSGDRSATQRMHDQPLNSPENCRKPIKSSIRPHGKTNLSVLYAKKTKQNSLWV